MNSSLTFLKKNKAPVLILSDMVLPLGLVFLSDQKTLDLKVQVPWMLLTIVQNLHV